MATVTLTFSAANATRIATALTTRMGLVDGNGDPRPADMADFKDFLVEATRKTVLAAERQAALDAASSAPVDIT